MPLPLLSLDIISSTHSTSAAAADGSVALYCGSVDTTTAFTPSPHSSMAHADSAWLFPSMEDEEEQLEVCPLSRKCVLDAEETALSHLRTHHKLAEYDAPNGEADINVPMKMDGVARRQAVLLKYDGRFFMWTSETRARADAERMISLSLVCLSKCGAGNNDIEVSLMQHSPHSSSAASPNSSPKSAHSFMSAVSTTTPTASGSAARYVATISPAKQVAPPHPSPPPCWRGKVSLYNGTDRHEHLVSRGEGLVLLHPTHKHLFDVAQCSTQEVFTVRAKTTVKIERL